MTRARLILGLLALGALGAGSAAGPAHAATASGCAPSAKVAFARVQLFRDADCKGPSVIAPTTGDANRPDFAAFANYDGSARNVDNTRSSLAINAGTCVRLFDGASYTGLASTNICAPSATVFWNLDRFDDRASSMRVCPAATPADCGAATTTPPPPGPPPAPGGFDPDPTGFGGKTTTERKRNFFAKMLPLGKAVRQEFGVPVSFGLAQAAQESAYGERDFNVKNFFGMKCIGGSVGPAKIAIGCTTGKTTEYYGGQPHPESGSFRKYRTVLDSYRDQGSLIKRRYAAAFAYVNDPDAFARAVARGGYATDPKYSPRIIAIMKQNNLYQYDH